MVYESYLCKAVTFKKEAFRKWHYQQWLLEIENIIEEMKKILYKDFRVKLRNFPENRARRPRDR